jgi:hypothetical protein
MSFDLKHYEMRIGERVVSRFISDKSLTPIKIREEMSCDQILEIASRDYGVKVELSCRGFYIVYTLASYNSYGHTDVSIDTRWGDEQKCDKILNGLWDVLRPPEYVKLKGEIGLFRNRKLKKKKVYIEVVSCEDCMYSKESNMGQGPVYFCRKPLEATHEHRSINPNAVGVPDWCRLPEVPKE